MDDRLVGVIRLNPANSASRAEFVLVPRLFCFK